MTTLRKLAGVLGIVAENLTERDISYSLIGALALGVYGLPRFTADIDLLAEGRCWDLISPIMERLGYSCFQKTRSFAQFDSELQVYGKIDFMLVYTSEGKNILERSIFFEDDLLGHHPVVQPTDYIVLKLMAVANNPDRASKDERDIFDVLRLSKEGLIPAGFDLPERDRIYFFADKFGQTQSIERLFNELERDETEGEKFKL